VIGPNGGKERDVTKTPRASESAPSFSPNGRTIAFVWVSFGTAGHQKNGIGVVNSDGTRLKHLTTSNSESDPVYQPTWSADGKTIYFERLVAPIGQFLPAAVFSIPAKGGAQHQVTGGNDLNVLASPLGGELAFVHSDLTQANVVEQLEITSLSGGNPKVVAGQIPVSDWSPDAKRFVYSGPGNSIWTVPADGGAPTEVADRPTRDEDPAFSPDGRFIVWTNEGTHDLWVGNSNGGGLRNLTHQPGFEKDPSWGVAAKRKHEHH
jgi:TolB protein